MSSDKAISTTTKQTIRPFFIVYCDMLDSALASNMEKHVFLQIKKHAGDGFTCHVFLTTLAKECGLARSSVQRAIQHLEEIKAISKENRQTKDKGFIDNAYTIHDVPEVWAGAPEHEIQDAIQRNAESQKVKDAIELLTANGYYCEAPKAF